jgi:hypothetical protein
LFFTDAVVVTKPSSSQRKALLGLETLDFIPGLFVPASGIFSSLARPSLRRDFDLLEAGIAQLRAESESLTSESAAAALRPFSTVVPTSTVHRIVVARPFRNIELRLYHGAHGKEKWRLKPQVRDTAVRILDKTFGDRLTSLLSASP